MAVCAHRPEQGASLTTCASGSQAADKRVCVCRAEVEAELGAAVVRVETRTARVPDSARALPGPQNRPLSAQEVTGG